MNFKALLIAFLSYPFLLLIWFFISPQYVHQNLHTYAIIIYIIYFLLPIIPGFIVGRLTSEKRFLHSMVLGLGIMSSALALWLTFDSYNNFMLVQLANIIVCTLLGTWLSQLQPSKWFKTKPASQA